tara:strand:+ start:89 stop:478 length:390 start_codon:yes stop_codon:yes gene_type:complete
MGYGMKYTKGGFPFKASPTKQKENTTPHFLEKKPNPTVKARVKPKRDEVKFMNEQDHQSVPTFTNSIPSPNDQALANAKSKQMTKSSDLEKNDDDRTHLKPSFPATPEGSKQRSDAEKALEKSEDEKGY